MKIHEDILLIGSGNLGHQFSHALDCNIYLLDCGGEYALIDAGCGLEPERIVENIKRAGVDFGRITHLLLTHFHGDHAAGSAYFQRLNGMKVIASEEGSSWLEQADLEKTSLKAAIEAGVYPKDFTFSACKVDQGVRDRDLIHIGSVELEVLYTPGHSRGHVCYLLKKNGRKLLFSGDTVFAGGKVVIQYVWDCVIQEYADTVFKLADLGIDTLLPGHGPFIASEAYRHIGWAKEHFNKLQVPPNL